MLAAFVPYVTLMGEERARFCVLLNETQLPSQGGESFPMWASGCCSLIPWLWTRTASGLCRYSDGYPPQGSYYVGQLLYSSMEKALKDLLKHSIVLPISSYQDKLLEGIFSSDYPKSRFSLLMGIYYLIFIA